MAEGFFDSYGTTAMKEDVRDLLTVISPDETPVMSLLGDGEASNTRHEWLTIPLPTGADNKQIEGTGFSYASGQTETRLQNYTQIFRQTWKVSGTVEAVSKYGRASEFDMRRLHALRALKVDMEYELCDNTASAAGATTATARQLKGLPGAAMDGGVTSTAIGAAASRAPLSEVMLNQLFQDMWTVGGRPDTMVCGGFVKRGVSGFVGAGAGRPIVNQNGDRVASNVIDVYESDFGRIDVIPDRYIALGSQVLVFQKDLANKAWLRPPTTQVAPQDGDYIPGVALAELTLEYLNPAGFGRLTRVASA